MLGQQDNCNTTEKNDMSKFFSQNENFKQRQDFVVAMFVDLQSFQNSFLSIASFRNSGWLFSGTSTCFCVLGKER